MAALNTPMLPSNKMILPSFMNVLIIAANGLLLGLDPAIRPIVRGAKLPQTGSAANHDDGSRWQIEKRVLAGSFGRV